MPYTTQGLMTSDDLDDYRELTDTGDTTYYGDNLPDFLPADGECTNCGHRYGDHDSIRVASAAGTPFACALY